MRKADLLALPVAVPEPPAADGKAVTFVCCFRQHAVNGNPVLCMDAFDATCRTLLHRSFFWTGDFITHSYNTDERAWKWRTGMIDTILNVCWWSNSPVPLPDNISIEAVQGFLEKQAEDPIMAMLHWQRGVRDDQLYAKHQRALQKVREVMDTVPPLPADLDDWIENDLLLGERYLLYTYNGRKTQDAFCTHCQKHVQVNGMRHGKIFTCPSCGTEATALASGRISKYGFTNAHHFSIVQRYEKRNIITRHFEVLRSFSPIWGPQFPIMQQKTSIYECVRSIDRKNGKNIDQINYEWGTYKKNHRNGRSWIPYVDHGIERERLYDRGLSDELRGTWAQFTGLDAMAKGRIPFALDGYIYFWKKHPQIELISKAGLYQLAKDLADSRMYYGAESQFSMDTLKRHMPEMKKYQGGVQALRVFKQLDDAGKKLDPGEVIRFGKAAGWHGDMVLDAAKYASLRKVNRYLEAKRGRAVDVLLDYWRMEERLGANMTEAKTLFPPNLKQAHKEAVALYNDMKTEIMAEGLEIAARRLAQEYSFQADGFMIVIPQTSDDLAREGKTLSHCVRTYAERMAKGETAILFVRKVEAPDEPFFTMEVRNSRVIQLRGKNNCAPPPPVAKFEKDFCAACHIAPRAA